MNNFCSTRVQGEQLGEGSKGIETNLANARSSAHQAAVETAKAGKARAKRRTVEGADCVVKLAFEIAGGVMFGDPPHKSRKS